MKKRLLISVIFLLVLCCVFALADKVFASLPQDSNYLISLAEFSLGELDFRGDFHVSRTERENCSVYKVKAEDLSLGAYPVHQLEAKIIKKQGEFNITYIKGDNFLATGKIDLALGTIDLTVNVNTVLDAREVKGDFRGKLQISGDLSKPWVKGTVFIKDGTYQGKVFRQARIFCSGYLPYLRLNDSRISLHDGSQFSMDGFVNVNDLRNMFLPSHLSSREVSLGDWKVFSGINSMGFSKDIDERMGVTFGSVRNKDRSQDDLGAEFRYQVGEDKFLKMRMEDDKSIVGFEQRNEF